MTLPIADAVKLHTSQGGANTHRQIAAMRGETYHSWRNKYRRYLGTKGNGSTNGANGRKTAVTTQIRVSETITTPSQMPVSTPYTQDLYKPYSDDLNDTAKWNDWKVRRANKIPVTVMCWYDLHIPDHDRNAIKLAIDLAYVVQPEVIVFGGDVFDFDLLSKFPTSPLRIPSDPLKEISEPWRLLLHTLTKQHPKVKIVLFDGNHEARRAMFQSDFYDTIEEKYVDIVRYEGRVWFLPQTRETTIGYLFIKHGERYGQYAAKNTLEDLGGAVPIVQGHCHRSQTWIKRITTPDGYRIVQAMASGALCSIPPRYEENKTAASKWTHGVVVAHVNLDNRDVYLQNIPFHRRENGALWCMYGGTQVETE